VKRTLFIACAALLGALPHAAFSQFRPSPPVAMFGSFDRPTAVICPPGVTSVFVECWGNGGGTIGAATYPTGGAGGGAYASGRVPVTSGRIYSIGDFTNCVGFTGDFVTVKAESGRQARAHSPSGAKGGQAANSVGSVKFSGGDGGNCFGVVGINGFSQGLNYTCGGGGGGATPTGNGTNGANGTAGAPGVGGGNGGSGGSGAQGIGATNGLDASPLMSGGGAGGTGNSAAGGKGLCKIS